MPSHTEEGLNLRQLPRTPQTGAPCNAACPPASSLGHLPGQVLTDGLEEVVGVEEHSLLDVLEAVDAASQILGHLARVNGVHAGSLQTLGESDECEERSVRSGVRRRVKPSCTKRRKVKMSKK